MIKKFIVFFFLLGFGFIGLAQLSKVHYVPPLTSGPSNADPLDQYFYISTPMNGDVAFTIKPVGGDVSSYINGQVSNSSPYKYTIASSGYSQLFQDPATTGVVTSDKGYIIESQDVIYVSIRMNAGGNAQAGDRQEHVRGVVGGAYQVRFRGAEAQGLQRVEPSVHLR